MTDQVQPTQGPGTAGPGPDGAGFTYRGAEQELIVVARPEARLRAGAEGVRRRRARTCRPSTCSSVTNSSPWSRCSGQRGTTAAVRGGGRRGRKRPRALLPGARRRAPRPGAALTDRRAAGDRHGVREARRRPRLGGVGRAEHERLGERGRRPTDEGGGARHSGLHQPPGLSAAGARGHRRPLGLAAAGRYGPGRDGDRCGGGVAAGPRGPGREARGRGSRHPADGPRLAQPRHRRHRGDRRRPRRARDRLRHRAGRGDRRRVLPGHGHGGRDPRGGRPAGPR